MAKRFNTLEKFIKLFTSELNLDEIERLIKRDAPGVYDFYARDIEKSDARKGHLSRGLIFFRKLFEAFLTKLTPTRRVLYAICLIFFFYGWFLDRWPWAILAFLLLNFLLALEVADKLMVKDELEVARDIQMKLMPNNPPRPLRADVACFAEAAKEVGGDYFDFLYRPDDPDSIYIVMADISGKGMAAALHMVQVRTILHSLIQKYESPREILIALSAQISQFFRPDFFLTISLAAIDANLNVRFCRAGHMPLLHFQKKYQKFTEIIPQGVGIGLPDPVDFAESLEEKKFKIAPGDLLFLHTDGVVETMDFRREQFGENRLLEILLKHRDDNPENIKKALLRELAAFRGAAPPHDDLTFVIYKVKEETRAVASPPVKRIDEQSAKKEKQV